ncbi:MAG TPA: zf-HC2 domain-containing protein [Thermodesulfobacteriota bacterium]|nr:zf-HC2 domain-containing protein [Thermodesulfobacteriota bacterium]
MCEFREELYNKWVSGKLTRIEQAFFEEHMQTCPECSVCSFREEKGYLKKVKENSLKFGFNIGLLASLLTSMGAAIALKNSFTYTSKDLIISIMLCIPIAIFMGLQVVLFKLSEGEDSKSKLPNLIRAIATLFVFSVLLYSALFNIPTLSEKTSRMFEFLLLFLNIVLLGPYWVIGNRLALQAYQRELETSPFVVSLLGTWLFLTTGASYILATQL